MPSASTPSSSIEVGGSRLTLVTVSLISGLVALVARPGADCLWLVSLGRTIAHLGRIPDGVPYAAAASRGWANVPVLSELVFAGLWHVPGARGLDLAQVGAVAVGLTALAVAGRRRGGSDASTAIVLLLLAVGSVAPLVAIRAQLFSLALFPLLLLLLHRQSERPTRAIWLLVPLLALWSSLHGAALVGALVAASYLLIERFRRSARESCLLLVALPLALCLTPALQRTPSYYRGVIENEAARRGYVLWAGLRLEAFDVLLVAAAVVLAVAAARAGMARWEIVALAGLGLLTVFAARNGVWFLMVAAVPAARGLSRVRVVASRRVLAVGICLAAVLAAVGMWHRSNLQQGREPLVADAVRLSAGRPILAEPLLAEEIAVNGGRVWMANPIDAFDRADQRAWLDWLQGRDGRAIDRSGPYVLTARGSVADRAMARLHGFRRVADDAQAVLYVRNDA
jgi:hypothetical protein